MHQSAFVKQANVRLVHLLVTPEMCQCWFSYLINGKWKKNKKNIFISWSASTTCRTKMFHLLCITFIYWPQIHVMIYLEQSAFLLPLLVDFKQNTSSDICLMHDNYLWFGFISVRCLYLQTANVWIWCKVISKGRGRLSLCELCSCKRQTIRAGWTSRGTNWPR